MQKILAVSYSPDPYLLDFFIRKTQKQYPEAEISIVMRQQAQARIEKHPIPKNKWVFPGEESSTKSRLKSVFSSALRKKIQAEEFDELLLMTGGLHGMRRPMWVEFARRTGIPNITFVEVNGIRESYTREELAQQYFVRQSLKGKSEYRKSQWSMKMKTTTCSGMPTHFTIEPTNYCNLKCPICVTGIDAIERPQGMMSWDSYTNIIDKIGSFANNILLYGTGEPFLNKRIYDMIALAKKNDIVVTMCSNGAAFDAERVVLSGLDELGVAFGGSTQEVHEVYRRNSDLSIIIKNIRALVQAKKRLKSDTPRILMDFVVQKQNEHQIDEMVDLAADLDVDSLYFCPTIVWDMGQAHQFIPDDPFFNRYNEEELAKGNLVPKMDATKRCGLPWFSSLIQWDSTISPCCGLELPRKVPGGGITHAYDPVAYPLGDISKEGITWNDIWNGEKYINFRKAFLSPGGASICKLCTGYEAPPLRGSNSKPVSVKEPVRASHLEAVETAPAVG